MHNSCIPYCPTDTAGFISLISPKCYHKFEAWRGREGRSLNPCVFSLERVAHGRILTGGYVPCSSYENGKFVSRYLRHNTGFYFTVESMRTNAKLYGLVQCTRFV